MILIIIRSIAILLFLLIQLLMRLQSVQVAVLRRCEGGECEWDTLARTASAAAALVTSSRHPSMLYNIRAAGQSPCQEEMQCDSRKCDCLTSHVVVAMVRHAVRRASSLCKTLLTVPGTRIVLFSYIAI
jgi:hypothetical protein